VALVRKALSESRDEVDQLSQLLKTALTGKAALEDKVGPPPSTLHPAPCTLHPIPTLTGKAALEVKSLLDSICASCLMRGSCSI